MSVSLDYMMSDCDRGNFHEDLARQRPIPTPRTSVPSPVPSPSLRHKSMYDCQISENYNVLNTFKHLSVKIVYCGFD